MNITDKIAKAEARLGSLTEAEKVFLTSIDDGFVFRPGHEESVKSIQLAGDTAWGDDRTIRAAIIRYLFEEGELQPADPKSLLIFEGVRITGSLNLNRFKLEHPLTFEKCVFEDSIYLTGTNCGDISFIECIGILFVARNLKVNGELDLSRSSFQGVALSHAKIKGNLNLEDLRIREKRPDDLTGVLANGCVIEGDMNAKRLDILGGALAMPNAHILGSLRLDDAKIIDENKITLIASHSRIDNDFILTGALVEGGISCVAVDIKGRLDFTNATIKRITGFAFNGEKINLGGRLSLRESHIVGAFSLLNGFIAGGFENLNAELSSDGVFAFRGVAYLSKAFFYWHPKLVPNGKVSLAFANIQVLNDDVEKWAKKGDLDINGLTYLALEGNFVNSKSRLKWIQQQYASRSGFNSQPYEQLTNYYRSTGAKFDASEVAIQRELDRRQAEHARRLPPDMGKGRASAVKLGKIFIEYFLYLFSQAWSLILLYSVGFGYRRSRIVYISVVFIALGYIVFSYGEHIGIMYPLESFRYGSVSAVLPIDYPEFEPLVYSIDLFLPFLELNQERYWAIRGHQPLSLAFHIYEWIHISLGWLLTGILLASFSPLSRRE